MPIKQERSYWTLSTDGTRTPIHVRETIEEPMSQPQQQIQQYVQFPQTQGDSQPIAVSPTHPPTHSYQHPVMVRPQQRSPLPFVAGAAGLFLAFYSWNSAGAIETLKQQNAFLSQQVATLQAQNQALKEMAAIVR